MFEDFIHQPGFLGTGANLATDLALVLMIGIATLFTIGFALARAGRFEAHRWVQTTAGVLSLILVGWLMLLPYRDFILPGLPGELGNPFYGVTTVHALLGLVALPFGLFVILRGNNLVPSALRFDNYKPYMRVAYILFMLTIGMGLVVYVVWFVTNPNPPVFE